MQRSSMHRRVLRRMRLIRVMYKKKGREIALHHTRSDIHLAPI